MDMYTHVHAWKRHLKAWIGRSLDGADYIFPHIAPNGIPHPDRHMSYERAQEFITEFSSKAGLTTHFSTHCF